MKGVVEAGWKTWEEVEGRKGRLQQLEGLRKLREVKGGRRRSREAEGGQGRSREPKELHSLLCKERAIPTTRA